MSDAEKLHTCFSVCEYDCEASTVRAEVSEVTKQFTEKY